MTAKTMPLAQWLMGLVCAQKNQSGLEALFTVKLHCGISVALAATGWKPESMPARGVVLENRLSSDFFLGGGRGAYISAQGLANVDWVTDLVV